MYIKYGPQKSLSFISLLFSNYTLLSPSTALLSSTCYACGSMKVLTVAVISVNLPLRNCK
jgi:hypothetical protein